MPTLAYLAARMFQRTLRRYGMPYMTAVRPIAEWSLPAGFAYDQTVDAIRNSAGTVLPNPEAYWLSDTVYIVPTATRKYDEMAEIFASTPAGSLPDGTLDVFIAQDDVAKVRAAHALQVGKRWFDVLSVQEAPTGYPAADGLWARLSLRVRG